MSNVAIDLHMHSVLSPCGDLDMTPNNIVNMAIINELGYIAVTDHNSAQNLPAITKVAEGEGLCILPGIEVTTKEEAHVLAYFDKLEAALELSEYLYKHLPEIYNRPDYFGPQYIMDEEDEIIGEIDKLLISATDIGIDHLCDVVKNLGGVIVPAHIDRKTYSIVISLGFVPPNLPIKTLEVSKMMPIEEARKKWKYYKNYKIIQSSDAHNLEDIFEGNHFIDLEDLRKSTLLQYLG